MLQTNAENVETHDYEKLIHGSVQRDLKLEVEFELFAADLRNDILSIESLYTPFDEIFLIDQITIEMKK
ncbi:MAG: hypothetical protein OEY38_21895 [Gammaproteobacteria bacterium]|nr:hypothetical protein [Gammaproteobacteria bacterium]